ncbi:MAG: twin-arginine translocation signal domain-containing protein [Barnesiella sp.]
MKDKQGLSRRDFIRNSMIAGGAMLLSGILPSKAGIPTFTDSEDFNFSGTDELLRGVSDIHRTLPRIPKPAWEMNWNLPVSLMMPDINPCCSNLMISVVMTGHI